MLLLKEIGSLTCLVAILFFSSSQVFGQSNFLVIAHRGAAGHTPENTITSITKAIELGANAIEIDIRQTKDGVPVAIHDASVDRTTNGSGDVCDFTLDEIKQLDAGGWFDEKYSGEKVPTLSEAIETLNDTVKLIIEFKGGIGEYEGIEKNVIDIIQQYDVTDRVILKSFDPNQIELLHGLIPDVPLLYVYAVRIPWLGMIIDTGISFRSVYNMDVEYLQPHRFFLSESFVKEAQEVGFKIIAWGVNDEEDIIEAIEFGVDGIETDYPERALTKFQKMTKTND